MLLLRGAGVPLKPDEKAPEQYTAPPASGKMYNFLAGKISSKILSDRNLEGVAQF